MYLALFDYHRPEPEPTPPAPQLWQSISQDLNGAAATIAAASFPTIVALTERSKNIGILEVPGGQRTVWHQYDYQPVLVEGFDSRLIDVGYLVRGDQATYDLGRAAQCTLVICSAVPLW